MKQILLLIISTTILFCACREEDPVAPIEAEVSTYKVAVIAPASQPQWKRTAEWAMENIRQSQASLPEKIDMKLVWIDESDSHLSNRMKSVLSDSSIVAVIGPIFSSKAKKMAGFDVARKKPLLFPCATATDLQRMYANCDYVWNLSASDVEEIQILLMQALVQGGRQVHLLAHDDDYGETFLSWTSFVAEQMEVQMGSVQSFESVEEEIALFKELIAQPEDSADILLYVPSSHEDIMALDTFISSLTEKEKESLPTILCSGAFTVSSEVDEIANDVYQGIELSPSSESGFWTAYQEHFETVATCGEAQFYDSFLLLSLALARMEASGSSLNESLKEVVAGRGERMNSWKPEDVSSIYQAVRGDDCPNLEGASGSFTFKSGTNSVEHSTYRHWRLHQHESETLEFLTINGSSQAAGTIDITSWTGSADHEFSVVTDSTLVYPPLDNCWALLVAGTTGWDNYRHQADVYAVYQLLRKHGYAKDHIITIAEDDIAKNPLNPYPGVVRVSPDGENVYKGLQINYMLSNLKPLDLQHILCGQKTTKTPVVFPSDHDDNIFIYWCGDGGRNELVFGNYVITGDQMASYLQEMARKRAFRKLYFALESCYSGSIGQQLDGIPGVLCMTAANENETSKADICDPTLGVWMSNGFTRGFLSAIEENPDITFYDLYYQLATSTWGSHVCIYNEVCFGSLYENRMREFLPN